MRTTIRIELFGQGGTGNNYMGWNKSTPFVAKVTGFNRDTSDFRRYALKGYVDYTKANSVGSRGVYKYYFVEDGLYEINCHSSWKKVDHYFLLIENGNEKRLNFEEAITWLNTFWELPY
jgi:hypothetical protein